MNKTIGFIIAIIIVGLGAFYGGMKYGQSQTADNHSGGFGQFQNLTSEQRQQRMEQFQKDGGTRRGGMGGAGFISGEILSKDDKSITIKLPDSGSKIIFYSSTTEIGKTAQGTTDDLIVGQNVMANGASNTDGSITAQTIQIRPKQPTPTPPPNN